MRMKMRINYLHLINIILLDSSQLSKRILYFLITMYSQTLWSIRSLRAELAQLDSARSQKLRLGCLHCPSVTLLLFGPEFLCRMGHWWVWMLQGSLSCKGLSSLSSLTVQEYRLSAAFLLQSSLLHLNQVASH
jgi:hypothetical protein